MSYKSVVEMAGSASLISRIAACAAAEGIDQPLQWAQQNVWKVCASPGWDDAWDQAVNQASRTRFNPDTGIREDVITDEMILAAVQPIKPQQPA